MHGYIVKQLQFQKIFIPPPQKGLEFPMVCGFLRDQNNLRNISFPEGCQGGLGKLISVGEVWIFLDCSQPIRRISLSPSRQLIIMFQIFETLLLYSILCNIILPHCDKLSYSLQVVTRDWIKSEISYNLMEVVCHICKVG